MDEGTHEDSSDIFPETEPSGLIGTLESLIEPSLLCLNVGEAVWGNLAARNLLGLRRGVQSPDEFLLESSALSALIAKAEACCRAGRFAHHSTLSLRLPTREHIRLPVSVQPLGWPGRSHSAWWILLDVMGRAREDTSLLLLRGLESLPIAAYLADRNFQIRYVNPAFEELSGRSRSEVLGADARRLRSNRIDSALLWDLWSTLSAGRPWQGSILDRRPDGGLFDSDLTVVPLLDVESHPHAYFGLQRDMTGKRWSEAEHLQRLDRLETAVHRQEDELARIREISELLHEQLDREETLRLILVAVTAGDGFRFNRAFLLLAEEGEPVLRGSMAVGPSNQEEAGRIWSELARLPRGETLRQTLRAYRRGSEPDELTDAEVNRLVRSLEIPFCEEESSVIQAVREEQPRLVNRWGETTPADDRVFEHLGNEQFAVLPMLRDHRPVGAVIVDNAITRRPIETEDLEVLDLFAEQAAIAITNASLHEEVSRHLIERETAYAELEAQQKRLVEAEKLAALGRMATIVAHEIRTPLACIGGYARSLVARMPSEGPAQADLGIIVDEVQRLESVIEDLLYYAKPLEPRCRPADINQLIEAVLTRFELMVTEGDVVLERQFDPDAPQADVDERMLRQVLINIINNAVEAMAVGWDAPEAQSDRAKRLVIRTRAEDGILAIEVEDTGIGIPADRRKQIGEAFVSGKPRGTGLGIYISKRIVDDHNGTFRIDSRAGEGTTVTIELPLEKADS